MYPRLLGVEDKNVNVNTDMSGLNTRRFEDRFEVFLRRGSETLSYGVEPDALLYGIDWPISSMGRTWLPPEGSRCPSGSGT